jgi:hypothetical protein
MLTAIAVVHWNDKRLPEQRAELYESILNWLIQAREARPERVAAPRCRQLLKELALAMQADPKGRLIQVTRHWAAAQLAHRFRPGGDAEPAPLECAETFHRDEELDPSAMQLILEQAAERLGKSVRQVRYLIQTGGRWLIEAAVLPLSAPQGAGANAPCARPWRMGWASVFVIHDLAILTPLRFRRLHSSHRARRWHRPLRATPAGAGLRPRSASRWLCYKFRRSLPHRTLDRRLECSHPLGRLPTATRDHPGHPAERVATR